MLAAPLISTTNVDAAPEKLALERSTDSPPVTVAAKAPVLPTSDVTSARDEREVVLTAAVFALNEPSTRPALDKLPVPAVTTTGAEPSVEVNV